MCFAVVAIVTLHILIVCCCPLPGRLEGIGGCSMCIRAVAMLVVDMLMLPSLLDQGCSLLNSIQTTADGAFEALRSFTATASLH